MCREAENMMVKLRDLPHDNIYEDNKQVHALNEHKSY